MNDLISRQAAIEAIEEYFDDLPIQGYYDMLRIIENSPAIDAVPVVRCKNCKHYSLNRVSGNALCDLGMNLFHPYDFCSQAEGAKNEAY